ncbi:acyltransferase [Musa troglodytarum]|uniref:Acyltransferase n=1 Tax=Musa troglodytarum TaxID=320322 RepID=A0A9E7EXU7_9LILI|nr:acyltransferase [Musa troglodytarum]URD84743.1 acyltransferase [Musa troglodytarum]
MAGLATSSAEMDLDRPNIEEYLTGESIREAPKKLHLRDLLDISPMLEEAAGAIVDGAFELDCAVCPVAIKYNKIFVDAFWNSKKVQDMISVRAGLKKVPWDGYLKYFRPSPKLIERKQQIFAESVLQRLEEK